MTASPAGMTSGPSIARRLAGFLLAILIASPEARAQEFELPTAEENEAPTASAEGATEREVSAELDASQDRAIQERLRATFAGVEGLRGVRVTVSAGVVRLSGEVPSTAARELAGQLARQIEDVALVENELVLVEDVGRRLQAAWDKIRQRFYAIVGASPLLLVGLAVVALFGYLGRRLAVLEWPYRRIDNQFLRRAAGQLVGIGMFLVGALIALEILDATALFAALLGTAGLFGSCWA